MTTRFWNGGTGDWYTATNWTSRVAPIPGDAAQVTTGDIEMYGTEAEVSDTYDNQTVTLGTTNAENSPAQITSIGARYGHEFNIQTPVIYNNATFLSLGTTGFAGTLDVNAGVFKLETESAQGTPGGNFLLDTNGIIDIAARATLTLSGRLDDDGDITVGANGTLVNTGTIFVEQSQGGGFYDDGSLTGGGTIEIGNNGVAYVELTVSNQTFGFAGLGGGLYIASPNYFTSPIQNFVDGDFIDLVDISETNASYNAATDTLSAYTVQNGTTSDLISLHVTGPTASSTLVAVSDGANGTDIAFENTPLAHQEYIAGGADAMGAETVQATMTTHAGVPITGAGVKIGIISNSFNDSGTANESAADGYLPENNGTCAVTVLKDEASGGDDEGQAMAQLIYQVAPGAQLYFYSGDVGTNGLGMADAVNALVAAGCNVIVDDIVTADAPFFQITGPTDTATQNAINAGVDFFTAASNYANNYYQAAFTATSTTLNGVSGTVLAQTFTNGTPYETLTLPNTTNIDLQWSAPFPTTTSGTSPLAMIMVLYNSSGDIAYTSQQDTTATGSAYASEPDIFISGVAAGTYTMAVYQTSGMPSVSQFKFILYGTEDAEIDDPAAENGSGVEQGHALIPGVNTVAASTFSDSPAYTGDQQTEWFSAPGPGELLYDSNGTAYATPVSDDKPTLTAPDGIDVSPDLTGFEQPFYGTSAAAPNAAAVAALMLQANPTLTPAEVTTDLEKSALNLGEPVSQQGAGLVQAVGAVELALACFTTGTRLRTRRGEVPVEELREDDLLLTPRATWEKVIWIGHRHVDCARHARPADVWPVRIRKDAFGAGQPGRDLLLSADHAVYAEGVLIPSKYLVNGTTVVQEPCDAVTYWHVELERHDVIFADGLPCESYLDTGNRRAFANGGAGVQLHPDFSPAGGAAIWEAAACAKLRIEGEAVARVAADLRRNATRLGYGPAPADRRSSSADVTTCDVAQLLRAGWYLANNPDVAASGMAAEMHFAGFGRAEGRLPCPEIDLIRGLGLIDPGMIVFSMADVVAAGADPVDHFCTGGWRERRHPNMYFDTGWYIDTHDVPAGMNPLLHYVLVGEREGLAPSRHFDPEWYRRRYAIKPSLSPLAHYLMHRSGQRVSPLPSFDVAAYAGTLRPGRDPYAHFLAIGCRSGECCGRVAA